MAIKSANKLAMFGDTGSMGVRSNNGFNGGSRVVRINLRGSCLNATERLFVIDHLVMLDTVKDVDMAWG